MRAFVITLAGAVGGAALAVAVILTMADRGMMPINDVQMQTYLMRRPELAAAMLGRYQQQEESKQKAQQTAALMNKAAFFDPKIAFVAGPADAKQTFVEFYDYDCPFCRASLPAIRKFYEANKDKVRFAFIEYPIEQLHGASAVFASKVSIAARRQPERYMDFHFALLAEEGAITEEMLYANAAKVGMDVNKLKADTQDPAVQKALDDSIALARKTGIDGTPTFILNGKMHPGMLEDAALEKAMVLDKS
jgi:protein-disulfide isomerase